MSDERYEVALPSFTGPLDLLLHLIERQELDITLISLAEVAAQYLAQIEQLKEARIDHLIDFIVIGARLALIKSRALLPQIPSSAGDDEFEEDPAAALLRQLREYRRFKQAAQWLGQREEQGMRTHLRVASPPTVEKRLDMSDVTVDSLILAIRQVLARNEALDQSVSLIQPRQITINDQIGRLRRRLGENRPFFFHDILSTQASRVEIAVTLLAILELIKRQEMEAFQPSLFGPIEIIGTGQNGQDH